MVLVIKTKCGTSVEEEKYVIPEEGATSSYFELKESFIDSTVYIISMYYFLRRHCYLKFNSLSL